MLKSFTASNTAEFNASYFKANALIRCSPLGNYPLKIRQFCLIICLILTNTIPQAQTLHFTLIGLQKDAKFVAADASGSFYVVQEDNVLSKYNSAGLWVANYIDPRWGDFTLDLFSPLQIGVFYKNFKKYVILDSKLGVLQEIDLSSINDFNVKNVIQAPDKNGFWAIDESSNRIKKINLQGFTLAQVSNTPQEAIELFFNYEGSFFLITSSAVYQYNRFWEQINSIETGNITCAFLYQNKAVGKEHNQYIAFDLETGARGIIAAKEGEQKIKNDTQYFFDKKYMFVADQKQVRVYF
jgi:hypothetical protein